MSVPTATEARFIRQKVEFLEQQKVHLVGLVEDRLNKLLAIGRDWLENMGQGQAQLSYDEVNSKMETAVTQLSEAEHHIAAVSDEDDEPTENTTMAAASRLSDGQSDGQAESWTQLKAQLQEVSVKQKTMEEQNNQRLEQMEKKMKKLTAQKLLKDVKESVSEVEARLSQVEDDVFNRLHEDMDGVSLHVNTSVMKMSEDINRMDKTLTQMSTRLEEMEGKTEEVREKFKKDIEEKSISLDVKMTEKWREVEEKMTERLREVESKVEETRDQLEEKMTGLSNNLEEVDKRMDLMNFTISDIEGQLKDVSKESEDMKAKWSKDADHTMEAVHQLVEDVDSLRSEMGKISTKTDASVSSVKQHVDTEVTTIKSKLSKLDTVETDLNVIKPKVTTLENKTPSGFCARLPKGTKAPPDTILGKYDTPFCNVRNCFDATSGIFTCPRSGLLIAGLAIQQQGQGDLLSCSVNHKTPGSSTENVVCSAFTEADGAQATGTGVRSVSQGDQIYVHVFKNTGPAKIRYNRFFCLLIPT